MRQLWFVREGLENLNLITPIDLSINEPQKYLEQDLQYLIFFYCSNNKIEYITIGPIFQCLNKEGFNSIEDYLEFHSKNKLSEKTILLKGSRGIALEQVLEQL